MRWTHQGRRLITGAVVAGLVAVGLTPMAAAHAADGPNLALGRPATAGGTNGGYPAGNVTDGSQASYWEGPTGSFPQWVQVDLGSSVSVDEAALKLPSSWGARTETLSVLGSADGAAFAALATAAGRLFDPSGANTVGITFTAAAVRYVRVQVTGNTGWNAAQISELEVYGHGGPVVPPLTRRRTAPTSRGTSRSRRPRRPRTTPPPTPSTTTPPPTGSPPASRLN